MQVKYSEKYCKHQLSQRAILEGSQINCERHVAK